MIWIKQTIGEPTNHNYRTFPIYTDEELAAYWSRDGQGHNQAVARGPQCVVVNANREQAIAWSRLFNREFQIPTCAHWDGKTISMYCGDASRDCQNLMDTMRRYTTEDPFGLDPETEGNHDK